jgi:hypothetical protein
MSSLQLVRDIRRMGEFGIRRCFVALGVVSVALLVLFGTSGPASGDESQVPQLTVQEAQMAFAATWPKFDDAFVQGQLQILARYSTAELLEAASGATGCGCAWSTPRSKVLYSVPYEHAYPVSFLAQISTPAPPDSIYSPYVSLVVMTKSGPKAQWRVAYLVRYASAQRYLTSSVIGAAPEATFPITQVVSQLAMFFTAVANTGSPPPDDNWPQSGSTGQEVQNYLDTKANVERMGDQQQTSFSAVDTSVAFAYPHGDLMCGDYRSISTVAAPPNVPIVQPTDQITWGALAPGTYTSFTKLGMHQVCYSVDTTADSTKDMVNPISFFESVYQTTGSPAG